MIKTIHKVKRIVLGLLALCALSFASCGGQTAGQKLVEAVEADDKDKAVALLPVAYEDRHELSAQELVCVAMVYVYKVSKSSSETEVSENLKRAGECYRMAQIKDSRAIEQLWADELKSAEGSAERIEEINTAKAMLEIVAVE